VPVVIDSTHDDDENVPEKFRELQWTRLEAGKAPSEFVKRILQLLSAELGHSPTMTRGPVAARPGRFPRLGLWLAVAVLVAPIAYLLVYKPWIPKSNPASPPAVAATPETASTGPFAPPPHSIAVLPFVNMSGDKEQEYLSDGLTEELLNSLCEVNELQVAARTSAFSFKGKDTDIATIARKLNVGAVLEGSLRRSGNTLRITAQLIDAITGFHLWSHTYDRDLGDVLKLETEIAGAVAGALKVSLLAAEVTKIELGGTRNSAAFDAYLRGRKAQLEGHSDKDFQTAIAAYTVAIGLDPNYALAYANRSIALSAYAGEASGPAIRESYDQAQSDARKAIALTPDLAEGHLALAVHLENGLLDFARATEEYERALALAPGNAGVLRAYGYFAVLMGRTDAGLAAARRAVVLDPLNGNSHISLSQALYWSRMYKESIGVSQDALLLDPEDPEALVSRGLAYYALGDFELARSSCEIKPDYWQSQQCLSITYHKLGRQADAEGVFAKLNASLGDGAAYQYAEIYAQWGDTSKALEGIDNAMRVRDPGVEYLKTDPLMDPLRKEPRFQAVMRQLKFPSGSRE
jgi:TolB-like protein/Flp pilus assembly protein TadD